MELLAVIPLIGFSLAWQRWQGTNSASAILHAVGAMLIFLYIGSLAGAILPATAFLMIAGTALAAVEGRRMYLRKAVIPTPVGVLILLCVVHWFVHSDSVYFYFDEYSHWGVFLREMLAHDQLWGADSNAMHPRYLPGTSLWQYYFAVFSRNPEGAAYLAQFVLLIAPLLVLWEKTNWRQTAWLVGILIFLIVAISNFGHGFTSLYVDHLLGTWFAGILLNYLLEMRSRTRLQLLSYLIPLTVVVLIKTTGVFFVMAAAGIIMLLSFTGTGLRTQSPIMRFTRALVFPLSALAIFAVVLFAWNLNRDSAGLAAVDSSAVGVAGNLFDGESIFDSAQQAELTRRFVKVVLHQQISKDETSAQYNAFSYPTMTVYENNFRLTTSSLLGFSAIAMFLLWRTVISPQDRRMWAVAMSCVWVTAVLYVIALYFGYRFVSATENGLILSSYVRYVHSMLLPVVIFCFAPLVPAFADSRTASVKLSGSLSIRRPSLIFALALVALIVFEKPYLKPLYTTQQPQGFRVATEQLTEQLRARIGEARLWVFFPNKYSNGFLGQLLQYQLSPGRVHVEQDADMLLQEKTKLTKELRNWEYVWLATRNPEYKAAMESLVKQELGDRVFRIELIGDEIRFVAVTGVFDGPGG